MAGGITYSGVTDANGGNLFQGLRLWVSQKVPMRNTILDDIRSNGGEVVALEKNADFLIADHARKDAPSGSISWKYVTDSVKNGALQLEDKYAIGWTPDAARSLAASKLGKRTRTSFTDEDDRLLVAWISQYDGPEQKMYQDLEDLVPRHTWQSWRARYVKKLVLLPQKTLQHMAEMASVPSPSTLRNGNRGTRQSTTMADVARIIDEVEERTHNQAESRISRTSRNVDSSRALDKGKAIDDVVHTMKDQFYDDLRDFNAVSGLEMDMQYDICGRTVELWDLSQAVDAQNVLQEEVDWLKVAEDLGYDWNHLGLEWRQNSDVLNMLQECYEENLAEFLSAMAAFSSNEEPELGPSAETDLQASSSSADDVLTPPPVHNERKRIVDNLEGPSISSKRRRLNRDAEIPATPEPPSPQSKVTPSFRKEETSFNQTPSQQLREEWHDSTPSTSSGTEGQKPITSQPSPLKPPAQRKLPTTFKTANGRDSSRPQALGPSNPKGNTPKRTQREKKQSKAEPQSNEEQIHYWIDNYQALGYSHKIVVQALKATTMTPGGLVGEVMESLTNGRGVPTNMEGVWTERDDKALQLVNSIDTETSPSNKDEGKSIKAAKRELARLTHKHGHKLIKLRTQFLEALSQEQGGRG